MADHAVTFRILPVGPNGHRAEDDVARPWRRRRRSRLRRRSAHRGVGGDEPAGHHARRAGAARRALGRLSPGAVCAGRGGRGHPVRRLVRRHDAAPHGWRVRVDPGSFGSRPRFAGVVGQGPSARSSLAAAVGVISPLRTASSSAATRSRTSGGRGIGRAAGRRSSPTSSRPPGGGGAPRTCRRVRGGPDGLRDGARRSSRPRCSSALHVSTGGSQPSRRRGDEVQRRRQLLGRALGLDARSPSALLIAITSASSSTPFLIPCRLSPVRASISTRNESTMSATAVSDWPTPTVSTNTTS